MKNLPSLYYLLFALFITSSCKPSISPEKESNNQNSNLPIVLKKGLEAHGGLEKWNEMKALTYAFDRDDVKEKHQIALDSRKAHIKRGDQFTLGFDGEEVWVSPNKSAYGKGSARFYHNLIFYFYAMPFVLADPGINYSKVDPKVIDGKNYEGVKVSYDKGVGDAPEDYYIAYFDEETDELYLLLYTVTYYSGETSEKFNALIYQDWIDVNGLKLPKVMAGYKYAADTLGEKRYERNFEDLLITENAFPENLFERIEPSEIDSLITKKKD